jgi:hypothetical protein
MDRLTTPRENTGRWNRIIAWSGFCVGAASGMIMGLWAFDGPISPPVGFVDYGETSRRLMRLGHIAFFGIGYLNLLLAGELPSLGLGQAGKRTAARSMNIANIVLPLTLMAAAAYPPLKYLLPVPATSALAALCLVAWGTWAADRGPSERAFSPSARQQEGVTGGQKDV